MPPACLQVLRHWLLCGGLLLAMPAMGAVLADDLQTALPATDGPIGRAAQDMLPWGPCARTGSVCAEVLSPVAETFLLLTGSVASALRLRDPAHWAAKALAGLPAAFQLGAAEAGGGPQPVAAPDAQSPDPPPLRLPPSLTGGPDPLVFTSADFSGGAGPLVMALLGANPLTLAEVRGGSRRAAPLPATWTLLLLGLGGLAWSCRRAGCRRRRWPLAAVVCLLALGACDEDLDPESALADAQAHLDAGDLPAAARSLRALLRAAPDHGRGRWLYAELNAAIGDYAAADKEYREALRNGISPNSALVPLVFAVLQQGRAAEVLRIELTEAMPPDLAADLSALRAVAALALGDPAAAAGQLAAARQQGAGRPLVLLAEARLLAVTGRLQEARASVERVLASPAAPGHAWHLCGQLAEADGDGARAATCYAAAAEREPWQPWWLYEHARWLLEQGRPDLAEPALNRLLHLTPTSAPTDFLLGRWLLALGLPQQAEYHFQRVLQVKPNHAEARYELAGLLLARGQWVPAQALLRDLSEQLPTAWSVRQRLAALLLISDDFGEARRLLAPALRAGQAQASALALYAGALVGLGETAEAVGLLRRLVARQPQLARLRECLVLALVAAGDLAAALDEQAVLAAAAPGWLEGERRLTYALLGDGQSDRALALAQAQVERLPERAEPRLLLGEVQAARGDWALAQVTLASVPVGAPVRRAAVALLAQVMLAAAPEAAPARVRDLLAKHLEQDPADVDAMLMLAALASAEPAGAWLHQAMAVAPDRLDVRLALARHWLGQRRPREAIALLEPWQAAHPDEPWLALVLGAAYLADGAAETAWQLATRARSSLPREPAAAWLLGRAALALGRPGADTALGEALALAPGEPTLRQDRVAALASAGDWATAAAELAPLTAGSPTQGTLALLVGWVTLGQGNAEQAHEHLRAAWRDGGGRAALLSLARTNAHLGRDAEAVDLYRTWLDAHPEDQGARLAWANLLDQLGDRAGAVAQWEQVVAARPDQVVALINLAEALQQGIPARALDLARRAWEQAADSPAVAATLAQLLVAAGDLVGAERTLARTLARAPQAHGLALQRARLLLSGGRRNEAVEVLAPLLSLDRREPAWRQAVELLSSIGAAD